LKKGNKLEKSTNLGIFEKETQESDKVKEKLAVK